MKAFLTEIMEKSLAEVRADILLIPFLHQVKTQDKLRIISIGKASNEMAKACYDSFGNQIYSSLIICPENSENYHLKDSLRVIGSHPLPDERSFQAGKTLLDFIHQDKDLFTIFLISGGGSSLVEVLPAGLNPELLRQLNQLMTNSEMPISEINCVRKHLSLLKGGHLLNYINPDKSFSFILSDIHTGEVENVSSGLTFKDHSTKDNAKVILEKYLPDHSDLFTPFLIDTPKEVTSIPHVCVADNHTLLAIVKKNLEEKGVYCQISQYTLSDQAKMDGLNIGCQIYKPLKRYPKPCAILFGGECTVDVKGKGKGGRCSELMMALSFELQFLPTVSAICFASDGQDGNAPACGAYVDSTTCQRICSVDINPGQSLKYNDTFTAFSAIGDSLHSRKTGTNLNDILIVFISQ